MSRRASLFQKQNHGKPKVRFPVEVVFDDVVEEGDVQEIYTMLRRNSIKVDINHIGSSGMTPLHTAIMEGNFAAVRLLLRHNADVNKADDDSWTPLHAACHEGHVDIARYLIKRGARLSALTDDAERPIDLVEADDFKMISMMLEEHQAQKLLHPDVSEDDAPVADPRTQTDSSCSGQSGSA